MLMCAGRQSLDVTLQWQQKRQQQRDRPQSPWSHESSLWWKQRPLQSREQRRRLSRLSGHRTSVQRRPSHSKSRNLGVHYGTLGNAHLYQLPAVLFKIKVCILKQTSWMVYKDERSCRVPKIEPMWKGQKPALYRLARRGRQISLQ